MNQQCHMEEIIPLIASIPDNIKECFSEYMRSLIIEGATEICTQKGSLVMPSEAVSFAARRPCDDMVICDQLEKVCSSSKSYMSDISDEIRHLATLAVIWNAGRVHGIREERQKRRHRK